MKGYRHYSFDLWLTIIRSNPAFKKQRALYFYTHYNSLQKTVEQVESAFKRIDNLCNAINEKTGKNIDADEMYLMVIDYINEGKINFSETDLHELYTATEKIFFTYLPVAYNDKTIDSLDKLKQLTGATFNLLSNTAFIKGVTLRAALQQTGIDRYFDFQLYSDEEGSSKPGQYIFKKMIDQVIKIHNGITLDEIIHIGDNINADIEGAKKAGIQQLLVNSNSAGIEKLLF